MHEARRFDVGKLVATYLGCNCFLSRRKRSSAITTQQTLASGREPRDQHRAPGVTSPFAHEHCTCTKRAKVERSVSTHKPREMRAREAADCRESTCHVISSVTNMTPGIRHLGSVSREGSDNTFNCTAADGEYVETIGDAVIVQHYVAEVQEAGICRMVSISDAISKNGRTKVNGGVETQRAENRRSDNRVHQSHPCLGH
jgi:hypothetical protein